MDLPCHLTVTTQAAVGGRIVVRLGRILRVEGDIGRRGPPLVGPKHMPGAEGISGHHVQPATKKAT